MNTKEPNLSADGRECLLSIIEAVDYWHTNHMSAENGADCTLARLRGLAASIVRILDCAEAQGWDVRDICYELNVGHLHDDRDNYEENDIDELLQIAPDELRHA